MKAAKLGLTTMRAVITAYRGDRASFSTDAIKKGKGGWEKVSKVATARAKKSSEDKMGSRKSNRGPNNQQKIHTQKKATKNDLEK